MNLLTEMTRYPQPVRARTCWKKTSAVPLTGGRKMMGQRTLFGPASYRDHTLLSSSSTMIWRKQETRELASERAGNQRNQRNRRERSKERNAKI